MTTAAHTSAHPVPGWQRLATHDVDEQALLLDGWNQHYDQLSPGAFDGQLGQARVGELLVFCESTNQALHQRGSLPRGLCGLGIPLEMNAPGSFLGQRCDRDALYVFSGRSPFEFHSSRGLVMAGVYLPEAIVRAQAEAVEHVDLQDGLLSPRLIRLAPPVADALRRHMRAVLEALQGATPVLAHAAARHSLERSIASHFVAAFVQGRLDAPSLDHARRLQLIAEAVARVAGEPGAAMNVGDLCRMLDVSRRTLQYCFQDVMGTSPMHYLRAVRLNGARRDIKHGASVTDAACDWGFWHLSRFASEYRELFNELPSRTALRHG